MSILDTFFILFEADTTKVDKGIKDSEKGADSLLDKLKKTDLQADKLGANFLSLAKKGAGLLGVGLSVAAIAKGVAETAASYTALEKLALQFRSTADAVDEFQDAGALLGLTNEDTIGGLKSLEMTMQDTFLGMGRAKKVYEELGLSVTGANGKVKSTTEFMGELAAKFKDMDRGTQIRVMERLGLNPALLKLFNSDMADLQKRMAAVDSATGFSMEKALKRSAEYTKANKALTLEVKTLALYFEKFMEVLKLGAMPVFTAALQKIASVFKVLVDFVLRNQRFIEGVFIAIGAAILYFMLPAAISGAIALWAMLAPFLLVGAAVLAVAGGFALLYDDIMNFIDGNDSLIGQILSEYPKIITAVEAIQKAFADTSMAAAETAEVLVAMWNDPAAAFESFKSVVSAGMEALFDKFPMLRSLVQTIGDVFTTVGVTIGGVFEGVVMAIRYVIDTFMGGIATIRNGVNSIKGLFGGGGGVTAGTPAGDGVLAGQRVLGAAAASPLGSQTSSSINNQRGGDKSASITVGQVLVQTQATDAAGISKAIGGSMETQLRQAANNYDDGVAA